GWQAPLLGGLTGFGCGLLLYILGAVGGGDAKWFGAAGAFAGPDGALWIVVVSVLTAGLAAVSGMIFRPKLRRRYMLLLAGFYIRTGLDRWKFPGHGGTQFPYLLCAAPAAFGYMFMNMF